MLHYLWLSDSRVKDLNHYCHCFKNGAIVASELGLIVWRLRWQFKTRPTKLTWTRLCNSRFGFTLFFLGWHLNRIDKWAQIELILLFLFDLPTWPGLDLLIAGLCSPIELLNWVWFDIYYPINKWVGSSWYNTCYPKYSTWPVAHYSWEINIMAWDGNGTITFKQVIIYSMFLYLLQSQNSNGDCQNL